MPAYTFRCPEHGERDVFRPMTDATAAEVCWCGLLMQRVFRMPHISAELTPTSRPQTVEANARERRWSKDRDAYKRMRHDGMQPRSVGGSAHIEKHASTAHEVAMGKIMPTKFVKEGVDLAQHVVGKDLEL